MSNSSILKKTIFDFLSSSALYLEKSIKSQNHDAQLALLNPMNLSNLTQIYFVTKPKNQRILSEALENILNLQNCDGSWNEVYPGFITKSTLATAYTGYKLSCLMKNIHGLIPKAWLDRINSAGKYVFANEINEGWFRKSDLISKDTVNVNMICALFFESLHSLTKDETYLKAARRGIKRVLKAQLSGGAFPYYTNRKHHLVPLVYHALIERLLIEFYELNGNRRVLNALTKAFAWSLEKVDNKGQIDWKGDLGSWVYRNFATYSHVLFSLVYFSKCNEEYYEVADRILRFLGKSQLPDGSFPATDRKGRLIELQEFYNMFSLILKKDIFGMRSLGTTILKVYHKGTDESIYNRLVSTIQTAESLAVISSTLFKQPENRRFEQGTI